MSKEIRSNFTLNLIIAICITVFSVASIKIATRFYEKQLFDMQKVGEFTGENSQNINK
jgi:hypothetical protein